jgi:hypothetical protein
VQCELYVDILKSKNRAQQKAENDYQGATGLNNLAELLGAQGKYDEAEPLYQ